MNKEPKRATFGSWLGMVMAAAGSAVGLGNIWRFPAEAGRNGGSAFIILYICCVFVLAFPVMVAEFVVGRHGQANYIETFKRFKGSRFWRVIGYNGVLINFVVLSFYSVVAGWTLHYLVSSLSLQLSHRGEYEELFAAFSSHPFQPLIYLVAILLISWIIVARGIQSGIEHFSKVMMPLFFVCILVLIGFSFTMSGFGDAMAFLFKPDFSQFNSGVVVGAMGQAFFSLSVGGGTMATYASYFKSHTRLVKTAGNVCLIDSAVAIMSGLFIFPAVFTVGGNVEAGPHLIYVTLPHVFDLAFGNAPVLAYLFSNLFYLLLVVAAITTTISALEVLTAYVHERFGVSRILSSFVCTFVCTVFASACSLSFGPWSEVKIFGLTFFDFFDFISAKLFMPAGGFLLSIFVGWFLERKVLENELTNGGTVYVRSMKAIIFLLRWVVPVGILLIFLNELFV